jgi:hypothetical protein
MSPPGFIQDTTVHISSLFFPLFGYDPMHMKAQVFGNPMSQDERNLDL